MYVCSGRGLLFLVGQWSSLMALNTRRKTMKAWSVIGLLCAATIFAMVPISPQVTPRGVELSVDQAQAVTYRRAGWEDASIGKSGGLSVAATNPVRTPTPLQRVPRPHIAELICSCALPDP